MAKHFVVDLARELALQNGGSKYAVASAAHAAVSTEAGMVEI